MDLRGWLRIDKDTAELEQRCPIKEKASECPGSDRAGGGELLRREASSCLARSQGHVLEQMILFRALNFCFIIDPCVCVY